MHSQLIVKNTVMIRTQMTTILANLTHLLLTLVVVLSPICDDLIPRHLTDNMTHLLVFLFVTNSFLVKLLLKTLLPWPTFHNSVNWVEIER